MQSRFKSHTKQSDRLVPEPMARTGHADNEMRGSLGSLIGIKKCAEGTPQHSEVWSSTFVQMLRACREKMSKDDFIQLMIELGDSFQRRGELGRAGEMYTIALTQGELHGERSALGEALIRRGDIYCRQGRWRASNADLVEGRKIYRRLHERVGVGKAENLLGINYAIGGDVKRAQTYIRRALQSFEMNDEKLLTGIAVMNLGIVSKVLGDVDKAVSHFKRAKSHFEEAGDLSRLAEVHHLLGMVYLTRGESAEALREFEKCNAAASQSSNRTLIGLGFLGKANVYCENRDWKTALSLADQSLEQFSILDDRVHLADVYLLKGIIHREINRDQFALWYLSTSLKINLDLENVLKAGNCYLELGRLYTQQHQLAKAKHSLKKSIECCKKVGAVNEMKRAIQELHLPGGEKSNELRRPRQTKV